MYKKGQKLVQVIIPSSVRDPLTYSAPPLLGEQLEMGMRVLVPLGARKVTGVVVDFPKDTSLPEVKEVITVLDDWPVLNNSLLKFCRWAAAYYVSSLSEVLSVVLPSLLRQESRRTVVIRSVSVPTSGKLEREVFAEVGKRGRVGVKTLARFFSGRGFYRVLGRLVSMGAVEIEERFAQDRRGRKRQKTGEHQREGLEDLARFHLTPEQEIVLSSIRQRLVDRGFETFLLHGVTGSGKTEIYLRAVEEGWNCGKRSLILVPEIALTPQLLDRVRGRFPDQVGVLHSSLTSTERWRQWRRISRGEVAVVVGARSAVFAPIPDLGLIVVDEEHDSSYKQEEGLRYHARDLAVVRGKLVGCPVLLGSATPSVESYENSQRGRYRLLRLTERVEGKALPKIETVDLRLETRGEKGSVELPSSSSGYFSVPLQEAVQENYTRGWQTLIFLNRRGFAHFLQCGLCGFVLRCPDCSISLTHHLKERRVVCHHCGLWKPVGDLCPQCGHRTLSGIGFGTEKIEEELGRLVPGARLGRMDRDTTSRRGSHERMIRQWEKGEIDILVGTQMITKGHDVGGVTLVGVILADLSLNIPDFRAVEKTFQLLSQVAGRSGRGKEPGRVILQTFVPDHYSFQFISSHDYEGFFASEMEFRRVLNYPPFSRLVQLRFESPELLAAEQSARSVGEILRRRQSTTHGSSEVEILGPAPAPIEKLRGRYRWQILMKGKKNSRLLELAKEVRTMLPRSRSVRVHVDVDPYNML